MRLAGTSRSVGRLVVGRSFVVPRQKVRRRKMKAGKKEGTGTTRRTAADKERQSGSRIKRDARVRGGEPRITKRRRMTANKEVAVEGEEEEEAAGSLHFSSNIQQRFIQFILTR